MCNRYSQDFLQGGYHLLNLVPPHPHPSPPPPLPYKILDQTIYRLNDIRLKVREWRPSSDLFQVGNKYI